METEWARKRRKAYFGVVLAPLGKCTYNAGMIANRNIMYSTVGIFLFLNVVVGRGTKIITLRFHWQALGTRLLLWESETFPTLQMFTVSYNKTLRAQTPSYSAPSIFAVFRNLVWEIWFENSGWPEKKVVLYHRSSFFPVGEKLLTRKKNPSLQNHFSRTTFPHFSRKVVAD